MTQDPVRGRSRIPLLALTAVFAVVAAEYTFHLDTTLRNVLKVGVYNNVMLAAGLVCIVRAVRVDRERGAWLAMGAAVLAWGIGNTVWTFTVAGLDDPPFPSYADIGFLAVYPPAYVAIVLLLRARVPHLRSGLWLDGIISSLAIGSVGCAVVFQAVLGSLGGSRAAVATNLAYPLADLTLIGLVVWGLALTGWRPGRTWGLIAAGLVVFSASDCLYLVQTATGSYANGSPTDLGWVAGGLLLAWAAWQPGDRRVGTPVYGPLQLVGPVSFGLLALGVLVYDHFGRINGLALVLATLSVLAVVARMALTFRDNARMLLHTRREAVTDALTGLANRRRLVHDLERTIDGGSGTLLALF